MNSFDATGPRVGFRRPRADDCAEFIGLTQLSQAFHRPWGHWPTGREEHYSYVRSRDAMRDDGFLLCGRESGAILGGINLNCIVRGFFQWAYLSYWMGAPYARQGLMAEGMRLVTRYAFTEMKLHRLEANIQPGNLPSITLVRKCGFRIEGYSPRYLQVLGEWCDHERWALLAHEMGEI